jgi:hypothetical protein
MPLRDGSPLRNGTVPVQSKGKYLLVLQICNAAIRCGAGGRASGLGRG